MLGKFFLGFIWMVLIACGVSGQGVNCQANFGYVYQPWLTQPEEPIYLFSDSSTGETASTTFLWSFGTGDFAGIQNPSFTYEPDDSGFEQVCLTITDTSTGCSSTRCDTIRVDNLCFGASYTYTQQGNVFVFSAGICGIADSIRWDFGDGTSATGIDTITHTYITGNDSFYVCMQVFLSSECQYLYPCKVIECHEVHIYLTGITNVVSQNGLVKIYPDPASDHISINTSQTGFPLQMVVTDITGNILLKVEANNASEQIAVNNLAPGIYFVQITNATKQNLVTKFVKQ